VDRVQGNVGIAMFAQIKDIIGLILDIPRSFGRAECHMIIEWTHRWVAAVVGILAMTTAFAAWRQHRHRRAITVPAIAAVAAIGVRAWVGRLVCGSGLGGGDILLVDVAEGRGLPIDGDRLFLMIQPAGWQGGMTPTQGGEGK
jgi:hypothetical protein